MTPAAPTPGRPETPSTVGKSLYEQPGISESPELREGELLSGQFEIKKKLGSGGSGAVYLARDVHAGEDVALKVVGTYGQSKEIIQALVAEYNAQKKIGDRRYVVHADRPLVCTHAGVDWVLLPMEPAEKSMRDWLNETAEDRNERLETGLEMLRQACRGVAAIHAAGLVHLDIKPENLLLFRDREAEKKMKKGGKEGPCYLVKVADFGLSRGLAKLAETRPELLADGIGTPAYMAPEQVLAARWKDVGPLADIYGLGLVLYELLDGDLPYSGTAESIRMKKVNPQMKISSPEGPDWLTRAAMACLERDPGARPADAPSVERLISENPEEGAAFAAAAKKNSQSAWEAFLRQYPNSHRNAEAKAKLEEIEAEAKRYWGKWRSELIEDVRDYLKRGKLTVANGALKTLKEHLGLESGSDAQYKELHKELTKKLEEQREKEEIQRRRQQEEEERRQAKEKRRREEEKQREEKERQETEETRQRKADPLAGDEWTEEKTGMEFIWVPGGTFMMGSNSSAHYTDVPVHRVSLDGFWLGKYPVMQTEWQMIMNSNPSNYKEDPRAPVDNVSWEDAQVYIRKLNNMTRSKFRLPTEAEWEYACRAGTTQEREVDFFFVTTEYKAPPVGENEPNEFGLFDMLGNVSEWCQDWYEAYSSNPQNNPTGPPSQSQSGNLRVIRGMFSSTTRGMLSPHDRRAGNGFRLAIDGDASEDNSPDFLPG
jgi:formylglycine-generating enzyme required for sulfatase activity